MTKRRSILKIMAFSPLALSLGENSFAGTTDPIITPGGPAPEKNQIEGESGHTIEYVFSWTCPHCAIFHEKTLPIIRTEFIQTGKARLIRTPIINAKFTLFASILARTLKIEDLDIFTLEMFRQQRKMITSEYPEKIIEKIAENQKLYIPDMNNLTEKEKINKRIIIEQARRIGQTGIRTTPALIMKKNWEVSDTRSAVEFIASEIQR